MGRVPKSTILNRRKSRRETGPSEKAEPVRIDILRRKSTDDAPYWQSFLYTPESSSDTVAMALTGINSQENLRDVDGNPAEEIRWEKSCLQKKCGACAMVICGRPMLACDAFLSELKQPVRLEPLRKFPVVADLMVDRSVMFRNLKDMSAWLQQNAEPSEKKNLPAHEASRCIQCGCCLEVCPNFMPDSSFFGMAAMVPSARILTFSKTGKGEFQEEYRRHIYEGCGKSLACRNICPAGIDIEGLLVRSNAAAVWHRRAAKK